MTPHRFRQLASRAALVACLSAGLIACGDDDDEDASTAGTEGTAGDTDGADDEAASGDPCEAIVEFNAAATETDTSAMDEAEMKATGDALRSTWDPIAQDPPEDVAEEVEQLTASLDDLAAGDPEAFDADATFESYVAVLGAVVSGCDFETLAANAVDFAFEGIPESVPAGTVAIELTNSSESEMHEMIVFQKPAGDTRSAEELLSDPAMEESGPPPVGFVFAAPGQTSTGLAELEAGDYYAVCFIPVGSGDISEEQAESEDAGGPPHFTQGMLTEFSVG